RGRLVAAGPENAQIPWQEQVTFVTERVKKPKRGPPGVAQLRPQQDAQPGWQHEMAPAETLVEDDARGEDDGNNPCLPRNGVDIEVDETDEGTVTYLPQSNLRERAQAGLEDRSVGIDIS